MSKYTNKKDQFTQPQKSKLPLIIASIGVVLIAAIVFVMVTSGGDQETINYFGEPVVESRSYIGEVIAMTVIEPVIEDDKVLIPLQTVNENNIVTFEIANDQGELVPLMAYITPSGRLFVGSSMCEPCRGRTFSLAGDTLLCDTCRTTYTIEDHEFISGAVACGSYPPVNMNPTINQGTIEIDLQEILSWRIRA
ncbi:DUF2318 domain-containing protein [Alkalicella caledoniensis]|uniref:DUF2318 domain-containing protein n=1 Tax=Alkalicella caledoniensis TaxID=2731377 RepID=A0A7G9W427_ALKCA|nr:Fe-S-containing protein [Alkalicella caledoniensis]QNO13439.1 DUF2318 domain-containing protein [Alkalicella caledoniensis]